MYSLLTVRLGPWAATLPSIIIVCLLWNIPQLLIMQRRDKLLLQRHTDSAPSLIAMQDLDEEQPLHTEREMSEESEGR